MATVSGAGVLAAIERALVERFGHQPQRAALSLVGVDPIEVLRFAPRPDERVYVTLGMARHPMTGAAESARGSAGPRAELLLWVRDPTDAMSEVWKSLGLLAATPAVEGFVYRDGVTVELGRPLVRGSHCVGVLAVAAPDLPAVDTEQGPVAILQALPATSAELAWCRVRGSVALRERWSTDGTDRLDLARASVRLT